MPSAEVHAPQQARSRATRQRLIEATLDCLVDLGAAATSTAEICRRAQVSQGALFKHFPSKTHLLCAAAETLFTRLVSGYRLAFDTVAEADDRLQAALDLLWGVFMDGPLTAAFELYIAARSDAQLADALRPVLMQHRENLRREAARLFPEVADHPEFPSIIDGIMATMQGAAVSRHVLGEEASAGERTFVQRAARAEFCRALDDLKRLPRGED